MSKYFEYKKYCLFKKDLKDIASIQKLESTFLLDVISGDVELNEKYNFSKIPGDFISEIKRGLDIRCVIFLVFNLTEKLKEVIHVSIVALDHRTGILFDPSIRNIKDDNAVFIGPCYTSESERGKGLYPYVLERICRFMRENHKKKRVYINTNINNKSSIRRIKKAGFAKIAYINAVRLVSLFFLRYGRI